jgi:alpha-D-ribose 1-methylphosphonate 5-triphosphate synthase subunit PhnH
MAAAKTYTFAKTDAGWAVVRKADDTVVSLHKSRDTARAASVELNTAQVETQADEVGIVDLAAGGLTAAELAEVETQADAGDGFEWDNEPADESDPRVTTDPAELAVIRAAAARLDALPTEDDEYAARTAEAARSAELLATVEADAAMEAEMDEECPQETEEEAAAILESVTDAELAETAEDAPGLTVQAQRTVEALREAREEAAKPAEDGATIVVRKLEGGEQIKLRGVGVVKVIGKTKVAKLKFLVEYERTEDNEEQATETVELWANAKYRLV